MSSVSTLPRPRVTSLSIVTPPKATHAILQEAAEVGVPAVWLQPVMHDDGVLEFARAGGRFATVVAVQDEKSGGEDGWCILVDYDRGLENVGKL